MKKILSITAILLLLTAFACKKQSNKTALIIRDCTGTYLRIDTKDYQVCNTEKTDAFPDNIAVTVTFKEIKECKGTASHAIVCQMYHENAGLVDVVKIK